MVDVDVPSSRSIAGGSYDSQRRVKKFRQQACKWILPGRFGGWARTDSSLTSTPRTGLFGNTQVVIVDIDDVR